MTAPVAEATAPTLNLPLAEAVLGQITKHPETHDQCTWGWRRECGTTYCIAGWALVLTPGIEFTWDESGRFEGGYEVENAMLPGRDGEFDPEVAGREVLGLTWAQGQNLFYDLTEEESIAYLRELIAAARSVTA